MPVNLSKVLDHRLLLFPSSSHLANCHVHVFVVAIIHYVLIPYSTILPACIVHQHYLVSYLSVPIASSRAPVSDCRATART